MALGMMTAGIGMAVNSIAWLVKGIPGLGIILAVIVFLLGHTYNLAVSILGAFVHTLRLNYVEFFPRFFTGGGERFTPFRLETKYVEIK
jgi:V/A-type H+-transporting ATPase subunit I